MSKGKEICDNKQTVHLDTWGRHWNDELQQRSELSSEEMKQAGSRAIEAAPASAGKGGAPDAGDDAAPGAGDAASAGAREAASGRSRSRSRVSSTLNSQAVPRRRRRSRAPSRQLELAPRSTTPPPEVGAAKKGSSSQGHAANGSFRRVKGNCKGCISQERGRANAKDTVQVHDGSGSFK